MFIYVLVCLVVGLAMLGFALWFTRRNPKELALPVSCILMGATMFWHGGNKIGAERGKGRLLPASAIIERGLYLLQLPTNTVVRLTPAMLNGLTATLEPIGPRFPAYYYEGFKMETNAGPVIAVRNGDGELVLKVFPLSQEEGKKQMTERPFNR